MGRHGLLMRTGCRLAPPVRQGQAGPRRSFREGIRRYQKRNRLDVLQHTQFPVRMHVRCRMVRVAAACKGKSRASQHQLQNQRRKSVRCTTPVLRILHALQLHRVGRGASHNSSKRRRGGMGGILRGNGRRIWLGSGLQAPQVREVP